MLLALLKLKRYDTCRVCHSMSCRVKPPEHQTVQTLYSHGLLALSVCHGGDVIGVLSMQIQCVPSRACRDCSNWLRLVCFFGFFGRSHPIRLGLCSDVFCRLLPSLVGVVHQTSSPNLHRRHKNLSTRQKSRLQRFNCLFIWCLGRACKVRVAKPSQAPTKTKTKTNL